MRWCIAAAALLSASFLCLPPAWAGGPKEGPVPGPETFIEPVTGVVFVSLPGGTFPMGSGEHRPDESPPHRVRLGSFSIGAHEVTRAQWKLIMGSDPSRFEECPPCPVEQVSYDDVLAFLPKFESVTGLFVRLPTEAEWEYAAGGGAPAQTWPGTDREEELAGYGWYSGSFSGRTHPVGLKEPNRFGLFDLGGNVAEWCSDWYGAGYYGDSPEVAPPGPAEGSKRVVRGGSWLSGAADLRVSRRAMRSPSSRSPALGFRLVAVPSPENP